MLYNQYLMQQRSMKGQQNTSGDRPTNPFESTILQSWNKAQQTIKNQIVQIASLKQEISSLKGGQKVKSQRDHLQTLNEIKEGLQKFYGSKYQEGLKKELETQQSQKFAQIEKSYERNLNNEVEKVKVQYERQKEQAFRQLQKLRQENQELRASLPQKSQIEGLQQIIASQKALLLQQEQSLRVAQADKQKDTEMNSKVISSMKNQLEVIQRESTRAAEAEAQLQQMKRNYTKEQMLLSAQSLKALESIKQFARETQSNKLKEEISSFSALLKIDMDDPQKLIQLYERRQVETKFKAIVDKLCTEFREIRLARQKDLNEIQQQKKKADEQIRSLGNEKTKLETEAASKDATIAKLTQDKVIQERDIASLKAQTRKMEDQIRTLKSQLDQLKKKSSSLQAKVRSLQEDIKRWTKKSQQLENTKKSLQDKVSTQEKAISTLQSSLNEKQKLIEAFKAEKKKLEAQISSLKIRGNDDSRKIADLTNTNRQLELKIAQKDKQIKSLENEVSELNKKIDQLQRELSPMAKKLDQSRSQCNMLKKDYSDLNMRLQDIKEKLQSEKRMADGYRVLRRQIPEITYYISREAIELDIQRLDELTNWFKDRFDEAKFFRDSDIIVPDNIGFLLHSISTLTTATVSEAKLIYRFDPLNTSSFHKYIDGKQNILCVFKLGTNKVVGGFSCWPLEKMDKDKVKQNGYGKGVLMDITNKRVFPMRRDTRMPVLTYDDYFFIFGNSELRLKPSQQKFFTNFAVANSTFDNSGVSRFEFLKKEGNEVECMGFEIYQIHFRM